METYRQCRRRVLRRMDTVQWPRRCQGPQTYVKFLYFIVNTYGYSGPQLRCCRKKGALLIQLSNCAWHCMCMIRLTCVVDVDAMAITFHRCRAANPAGQYFTMDTRVEPRCSAGQVIRVQSALLGYSVSYNPHSNPPTCPWQNCTKLTDVPARLCDGRTSCRISQTVLNSPGGTFLCALQRDGNFIRIEFTCVTGMISLLSPYFFNIFRIFHAEYCDTEWQSVDEIAAVSYFESVDWIYTKHSMHEVSLF